MSVQTEEALLKINIDKKQASLSLDELKAKYQALTASISKMNKEDDPALYEKRIAQKNQTKAAIEAETKVINGEKEALKQFQAEFTKGIREAQAAATNNPITKFTVSARNSFDALTNSVSKSPLAGYIKNLKGTFSGNDLTSSPFFTYINTGFRTASAAVDTYRDKNLAMKAAVKENQEAQELLSKALEENAALQETVNVQLAANKVAQEESAAAVIAATTMDEAEAAALTHKKLVQEEAILTTQAQKLAENEATIATEAQTVAMEAQAIATAQGSAAMRVFKAALASTGIGLIIVALASLVSYFAETNEGSKKFQVVMAQLNALFQESMKLIAPIGKALFDTFSNPNGPLLIFTGLLRNALLPLATYVKVLSDIRHGNFGQVFTDIKNAMASWSDNMVDVGHGVYVTTKDLASNLSKASDQMKQVDTNFAGVSKTAKAITEERQRLVVAERDWSVEKSKQTGQVALYIKQLRDQNLTEQQRIAIADKAKSVREEIYNRDLAIAKQNESLVEREQALRSKKDYQAIADAKIRVQEVTNAYLNQAQVIENKQSSLDKKGDTRAASNAKAYQKLLDTAKSFYSGQAAELQSANDKEVALVRKKYDDLINEEKEFLNRKGISAAQAAAVRNNIDQLEIQKKDQVNAVLANQERELAVKIQGFHDQLAGVQATEYDRRLQQINQQYDAEVVKAGTNADQLTQIEIGRQADISTAKTQEEQRLKDEIQKIRDGGDLTDEDKQKDKLAKINQHYDDEIAALKKNYSQQLQETQVFKDAMDLILGNKKKDIDKAKGEDPAIKKEKDKQEKISEIEKRALQSTANDVFAIQQKNRQADTNAAIKKLEDQKTVELSNRNLTEAQKAAINEKYAKQEADIKLKAWKADQQAAIAQAIINGAIAMTKAAAQTGILSFAWDPIIALETAGQVALIATQKPPQFAKGGIIDGPTHANGGVPLIDGNTGRAIAEVEKDETLAVFSAATTKNNGSLINQLLFNSMYRNGATVDTPNIKAGIKMEKGGAFNQGLGSIVNYVQPGQTAVGGVVDNAETHRLLNLIVDKFDGFSEKPWQFPMRQFMEVTARQDAIDQKANPK